MPLNTYPLIMEVFREQMAGPVLELLHDNRILMVKVPANMTHLYQTLDLSVNNSEKAFMHRKFKTWYREQVHQQLDEGKNIEDFKIDFRLTTMKPLHASWLIELYDKFTSEAGQEIVLSGWHEAGITDAAQIGKT